MAISINWATKVISVPQSDLTFVSGSLYELNVNTFRLWLKDIEDGEEGMAFLDTHRHNTQVTLSGVTYARTFEVINGYTVTFEDGQYSVRCVGANHNLGDVKNVNQVSLIIGNSAGLITVNTGGTIAPTQQEIRDAMKLTPSSGAPAAASIDDKIDNISVVATGGALNKRADSFVTPPIKGTVVSGTYLDTYDLNGVYHRITHDAGDITVEYEFNVGADNAPVSVTIIGRMHGAQNGAQIQAYHWGDALFRQIGTLAGKTQDVTTTATLFIAQVGTGVDAGRVRIRFVATGVNNDLYIDQLWVSYAALVMDANAVKMNDATIIGDGTPGNLWRGA